MILAISVGKALSAQGIVQYVFMECFRNHVLVGVVDGEL